MISYCGLILTVVVGTVLCDDVISHRRHASGIDSKLKCPGRNNRCSSASKSSSVDRDVKNVNCHCDDLCRTYDDCCDDYSTVKSQSSGVALPKEVIACQRLVFSHQSSKNEFQSNETVYLVNRCPSTYKVSLIVEKCHASESASGPFHLLPVNGRKSGVLYRNCFCAVCNGEETVLFWTIVKDISLQLLESLLRGEPLTAARNRRFLRGNDYRVRPPTGYAPRSCQQVVARCRSDWNDYVTREKCENESRTATAVVYSANQTAYRNQYCALCNFETGPLEECPDNSIRQKLNSSALGVLQIDLNLRQITIADADHNYNSTKVIDDGLFSACKRGWIYDPFDGVCLPVFCGDGYKLSAGGCVRVRKRDAGGEEEDSDSDCARKMKLEESEYERLDNDFLFVKLWNVTLSPESYRMFDSTLNLCHPKSKTETDDSETFACSDGRPSIELYEDEYIIQANGSIFVLLWNMTINADEHRFVGSILEVCYPFQNGYTGADNEPFANCNYTVLNLREGQYTRLANDSIFVSELNAIFNRGEYVLFHSVLFVCASFTPSEFGKGVATLVGISISLVSLLVLLVIYMVFSELRNIPGKCVICLAVSLFVGQFSFCFIGFKGAFCFYLAAIVHFAFLASFAWTSVLAFDICRTFLSHLAYSDGGTKSRRFLYYSAFAWGLPSVIVVICICMDFFSSDKVFRPGYGDGEICWISNRMSLIIFFIVPLGVSLVGNFVLFSVTVFRMCRSSRKSGKVLDQRNSKMEVLVYVKLSFIMGLTWIFAFLANFTQWDAMWYLFILFNTLQGAFLCFSFVCTKKVFRLCRPKTKYRFSSTKKDTSFQTTSLTTPVSP